jgi:hypothetical protein
LELQLELLDDFRVRFLQLLHETLDPLSSRLIAILNTINYLASVLQEWGGLTVLPYNNFFLKSTLDGTLALQFRISNSLFEVEVGMKGLQ